MQGCPCGNLLSESSCSYPFIYAHHSCHLQSVLGRPGLSTAPKSLEAISSYSHDGGHQVLAHITSCQNGCPTHDPHGLSVPDLDVLCFLLCHIADLARSPHLLKTSSSSYHPLLLGSSSQRLSGKERVKWSDTHQGSVSFSSQVQSAEHSHCYYCGLPPSCSGSFRDTV